MPGKLQIHLDLSEPSIWCKSLVAKGITDNLYFLSFYGDISVVGYLISLAYLFDAAQALGCVMNNDSMWALWIDSFRDVS